MDPDLLQPTLSQRPTRALYSSTTLFACGVFGKGLGALAIAALNIERAGRWRQDGWLLLVGLPLALGWPWLWLQLAALTPGGLRVGNTLVGMAIAGAAYGLQRELQRAQDLFGEQRPNGWRVGVPAVIVGALATGAIQSSWLADRVLR